MPEGGPFKVPGADCTAGFGLAGAVEDPATGDWRGGVGAGIALPTAVGVAIMPAGGGHYGPLYGIALGSLYRRQKSGTVAKPCAGAAAAYAREGRNM